MECPVKNEMVASKDLLHLLVLMIWVIIEDRLGFGGDFP